MRSAIANIRIGAKLTIASLFSVFLLALMIYIQITGNAAVRMASENAVKQQTIARDAIDAKASIRGMQTAVRDIRLAQTAADIQKAIDYLAARQKSAIGFADEMLDLSQSAESRVSIGALKAITSDYIAKAQAIIAARNETISLGARQAKGGVASPDDAARIAALNTEASRLDREITLPIATELEALANKVVAFAKQRVQEENAVAATQMASAEQRALIVGGLVALVLLMTCIFSIVTIARPMRALSRSMLELAHGNFDVVLPGLGRKDEIGEVAGAVDTFKVKAQERAMAEVDAQRQQEHRTAEQRKVDMCKLADQFETAVGEIIETVSSASTELEVSANSLTRTADSTRELSTAVAAASEEASTNVQSVASASEEMASSVNEISRQVQESARIAGEAVAQANTTNDRVNALSKAASRIGDVVELINTVAGQTNLLALNATIEAARAGEAGRGFAVVASEVKALAEQTAKATEELSQQIGSIQAATRESAQSIGEIGITIGRISEIASTIAAAVEEQGAATQEVSRNVQQAAQGTQQVASSITQVQRGASETGSASSQVLAAAQSLSKDSRRLKIEVSRFLDTVRAA